ncbi:MAG: NblA/ycf18 family protein [Cyanobacteria bacterium J06643_13]
MDKLKSSLSVEQEFSLRVFSDRIQQLSRAEAQKLLTQMHYQMMLKENLYQELFLNQEQDIASVLFGVEQYFPWHFNEINLGRLEAQSKSENNRIILTLF